MADKPLLCLGTGLGLEKECSCLDQIDYIKNAGYDAFFTDKIKHSDYKDAEAYAEKGAKLGLVYQSIHAPFYGMDDIWHDESGELSDIMITDLLNSIDDCARFDVPLVIMHAIIGMDNVTPNKLGVDRLEKVIDYAVKRNIKIGFENTEGEMYLDAIFERYGDVENVGFTFDSGHEMCYNHSEDMLARFGKYIFSTHLNDNYGMTDPDELTFLDDRHLMPFDGKADWEKIAQRLRKCNFDGILTFELNARGRSGDRANTQYLNMNVEEYINETYRRAEKFREMFIKQ